MLLLKKKKVKTRRVRRNFKWERFSIPLVLLEKLYPNNSHIVVIFNGSKCRPTGHSENCKTKVKAGFVWLVFVFFKSTISMEICLEEYIFFYHIHYVISRLSCYTAYTGREGRRWILGLRFPDLLLLAKTRYDKNQKSRSWTFCWKKKIYAVHILHTSSWVFSY